MRNRLLENINFYQIQFNILVFLITVTLGLVLVKFFNIFLVLFPAMIIFGLLFYRPEILILFLVLYLPFEQLVFQSVHFSHLIYFKLLPEIILYIVLLYIIITKIVKREPLYYTPLNLPLLLIFVWAFISILVNEVPLRIGILGLRQVFRYSAVFFILSQYKFKETFHKKLIKTIIVMAVFESLIGAFQIIGGEELLQSLFYQRINVPIGNLTIPLAGYQSITDGSRIYATMGRYDLLGNYLTLGVVLAIGILVHSNSRYQKILFLIPISMVSIVLVQTFSRQSIAGALIGIGTLWVFSRKKSLLITFSTIIIFFIIMSTVIGLENAYNRAEDPTGNALERIVGGFYIPQWTKSNSPRAYVIIEVGGKVLKRRPLTGVGPGAIGSGVTMGFGYKEGYKKLSTQLGPAIYTSDVGWISLLAQYGIIGVTIFITMLIRLLLFSWRAYHESIDSFSKSLYASYGAYVVAIALMCFFSHPFEIRYVSFYFWLIGGVIMAMENFHGRGKIINLIDQH